MILALAATPLIGAVEASTNGGLSVWVTAAAAILAAVGGGGGLYQLLKVRSDKQSMNAGTSKARAEAADILSDISISLVLPLKEEVARLSIQVNTLEMRLIQERKTADTRIAQLESDIASRDMAIQIKDAELIELRRLSKSTGSGWPGR